MKNYGSSKTFASAAGFLGSLPCEQAQNSFDAHLGQAVCIARPGRLLEAEVEVKNALNKDPKNPRLMQFAEQSKSLNKVLDDYQFDSEIHEQQLVRRTVEEGMKVFDVGAHVGKYTKLFSLLVGDKGRVYSFEPTKESFKKLTSAVRQFNCGNVTLLNKAVYSQNCNVVLHEFPEEFSAWNSLGLPQMKNPHDPKSLVPIKRSVEVEALALDSFCQQHNINKIDYLKLDVEGSEFQAFIGASNLLENKAIRYLQFEISEKMLQGLNTKAKFIFDFLNSKGYECHRITKHGNIGDKVSDSDSFYENYIAFPRGMPLVKADDVNRCDRNTTLNYSMALKTCGKYKEAEAVLPSYLNEVGDDSQALQLLNEIDNLTTGAGLGGDVVSQQILDNRQSERMKRKRTGIIVFGHTRSILLWNLLQSLRRQGTTNDVHVWLDGHHGRPSLISPVKQCAELVKTQFPQVHLMVMNGNVGIEKLTIDGLSYMSSHYERIIVLEDDCFPTSCAIDEFEKGLNDIERRPEVYSVYGHHFLTESEGEMITRFQGWGWATTREKLLPVIGEMKKCFAMSEPDYLQWARKNLTPEVIKRLDVTPGRNCVPVIATQFCWDGCTCLVTAMRGLVHKKTSKRVIYNCGMGDGSTHFPQNDRFRQPPFNMITPQDVWTYYDSPPDQGPHSVISRKMESPQTTSPRDTARTSSSVAILPGHKSQTRQAEESGNKERLGTQIVVDSLIFTNVKRTKYLNNSVGFNDKYIIKIEHEKHPLKLRSLSDEIDIIKHLNSRECVSCPRLVSEGKLKSGERYFIQERIERQQGFNTADMVFSIVEQKNFGVCEGDLKKENLIFDSDSLCYIIDYDQAIYDERFVRMGNIDYLDWFAQFFADRWRRFGHTDFYKWGEYDKNEIFGLFKNDSFNLAATTLFKEQITTNTKSGIYHSLRTDKVYIDGARDLNPRLSALNTIEFKKGESVLDVGCNMGLLGHYLHDRGCRVTGIDMDRKIIIGAKMVANILNKNIQFKHLDLDTEKIETSYDTICLFSVIHHVKQFKQVTENIVQKCNRIILECGLKEHGSKPIGGKWMATSGWEFNSLQKLVCYLETVFRGFKFQKCHDKVDRDRQVISFTKEYAATAIQLQSKPPTDIQENKFVVQQSDNESEYLVSAIVSTYNSESFIRGCLQNLENQTIADRLEIIVVNSGSQQNEEAIIKEFQNKYDNIKYIKTEQRETIYKAWNRGIKAASGKYITNANTDDRHRQDALEIMARSLDENTDKVLVYTDQLEVNEIDGRRIQVGERINGQFSRSRLFNGECPPGSQPMWRRGVHEVFGYFDESFTISGDYEFWFRLTQTFDFIYVDEILGERLVRPDAVSIGDKTHLSFENIIINKCYNYALQTSMMIDQKGISNNPLFSDWPEIHLWKRKVKAKIQGTAGSKTDTIRNQLDLRKQDKPKLSVVVVTHNRQQQLIENLNALQNQSEDIFEAIIVSNGGKLSAVMAQADGFKYGICGVELTDNFGPSYARNLGASKARADYIAFLDDDAVPDKDFVCNIVANFKKLNICGLRGKVLPRSTTDSQMAPACYDLGNEVIFTACEVSSHSAFKKDIFQQAGGFDRDLFGYENQELSYRIYKSQNEQIGCIAYVPDVIVYHDARRDFEQCIEKSLREKEMSKLARRKWPEIELYLQYIRSYYPQNIETVEKDYLRLISNSVFIQEKSPQEAFQWAQKAVSLEPNFIKGRYLLGSLHLSFEQYDEAVIMLEPVFGSVMQSDEFKEPDSGLESNKTKAECYLSTGTKLAQCYMMQGKYGKVKQVYSNLLNEPLWEIPEQQRANMLAVLAKLDKTPPAPVTAAKKNHIPEPVKSEGRYLVSAIVSTYNSEEFLRGCLDDLEQQTIADKLEIIVVNSGSMENEEAIVREYRQKYNNIVYIKTEHREGIYAAWNRAVRVAQGTFLTNANTDDRHRNDALEIMAKSLYENPDIALVYGDQICTDTPNGTFDSHHVTEMAKRPEYSQGRLLFGCCVGSQPMWRKSLHNELGYFDETLTCAGDWDFWLRISSKYKFKRIPDFLGLYYYNKNGIEHGRKIHSLYERYMVGRRYGNPYISVIPVYKSQDNPLVSVIMPAYNAAEHIAEAIESVLIQNYRNFELIIIDDGSTDNTKDIVAGFKDDKIKYFYKDNGGPSGARNLAISKAVGQYIMPLDADDMMTPDFIARHLMEFEKHPEADLVYCDVLLIDDGGNPLRIMEKPEYRDRRHLIRDLFRMGHPVLPFRLGIRRSVFDKIGFYDEDLLVSEDYDMMRRFIKAGLRAHHLSEPLHLRRMHAGSLSKNNLSQKAKCHFEVVRRFTDTFTYDELFPDVAWNEITPERRPLHAKCLVAATYLAVGQAHVTANSPPVYTKMAFEQAWSELNDCLEMNPDNRQIRDLLQKCELGRQRYEQQAQMVVC